MPESGTLFVVATPIGNLEDLSIRAARILREVDRIACEDTRVTRKLLSHLGLSKPLLRHDVVNERESTGGLLALLAEGLSIALVSDAGTPCLSDPGERLVAAALAAGRPVVPIPGPSALTAAVSASGLPALPLSFHGFLPKRSAPRRAAFSAVAALPPGTHAFFVPARDLPAVTRDLAETLSDARVAVARELTKLHESWTRGAAPEVAAAFAGAPPPKGEAVLLLHLPPAPSLAPEVSDAAVLAALRPLLDGGLPKKLAAETVARELGLPKRRVYRIAVGKPDPGTS